MTCTNGQKLCASFTLNCYSFATWACSPVVNHYLKVKYDYEGNGLSPRGLNLPQLNIIVWRFLITFFSLAKCEWNRDILPP